MDYEQAIMFAQWLAKLSNEVTTEVSFDLKISGYEDILLKAFLSGIAPGDEELIGLLPYRLNDPELIERDIRHQASITNPVIREWLDTLPVHRN